MSKAIITALADKVKAKVEGCKDCGGSGHVPSAPYLSDAIPCPTCAPYRELLEKYLCWHEIKSSSWDGGSSYESYCTCGHGPYNSYSQRGRNELFGLCSNPDLTTARSESGTQLLIVYLLDKAGELEGFLKWHWKQCQVLIYAPWGFDNSQKVGILERLVSAKILLDGKHLVPAVAAYLEVV